MSDINHPNAKHGFHGTRLYNLWNGIKGRCLVKTNTSFHNYGAKGITLCKSWLNFIPFKDWALKNGYKDNLTIDRIDSKKGYDPSNCEWVTFKENMQNKWKLGCKKGHVWKPETTYTYAGKKRCKICHRENNKALYFSKKTAKTLQWLQQEDDQQEVEALTDIKASERK